eukprot:TRINITY_DN70596_c0_g1_i1.p1 TRINITY_DN70596_c0_g1~~TRINITY_DN70596_c0_g1_i1.p1  ORF type:complete len:358 (+),score=115.53 TRINITY_DN70596_c0_g1_i1:73-1146(+)
MPPCSGDAAPADPPPAAPRDALCCGEAAPAAGALQNAAEDVCLISALPDGRLKHSDRDLLDAHLATPLRVPPALPCRSSARPRRSSLRLRPDAAESDAFRGRAFVVDGLLTPEECGAVREAVAREGLRELLLVGGAKRRCERLAFRCPELDERLWERVRPMLGDEVCTRENSARFLSRGMEGRWEPSRLSGVLRVVRYTAGGHIAPHYDGEWVDDDESRSLKTILLYLNEGYSEGLTNFLDHRDDDVTTRYVTMPSGATRANERDIVGTVPAAEGSAIVFDAKMLHEGTEVASGEKWLLRADVVYRRAERADAADSVRSQATALLNEAEFLEEEGRLDEAVLKYRRAYKLCPELQYE